MNAKRPQPLTTDIQAIFCRRRHQPRRPPPAKIRPGSPAPATGRQKRLKRPQMIKHLITDPEEFALRYLICCGSGGRDDGGVGGHREPGKPAGSRYFAKTTG